MGWMGILQEWPKKDIWPIVMEYVFLMIFWRFINQGNWFRLPAVSLLLGNLWVSESDCNTDIWVFEREAASSELWGRQYWCPHNSPAGGLAAQIFTHLTRLQIFEKRQTARSLELVKPFLYMLKDNCGFLFSDFSPFQTPCEPNCIS